MVLSESGNRQFESNKDNTNLLCTVEFLLEKFVENRVKEKIVYKR